jgi:lipopolysaccharide export system protein LptA
MVSVGRVTAVPVSQATLCQQMRHCRVHDGCYLADQQSGTGQHGEFQLSTWQVHMTGMYVIYC